MRSSLLSLVLLLSLAPGCGSEGDGGTRDANVAGDAQDGSVDASLVGEDAAAVDSGDRVIGGSCATEACPSGWACVRSTYTPGVCIEPDDAGVCPRNGHEGAERVAAVPRCCAVYDHVCMPVPDRCAADPTCGCYATSLCPIDHEPSQVGGGCRCTAATESTAACACGGA